MISIIIQSLALARLLKLFAEEEGPFRVLERFRRAIGIDEYGVAHTELGGLFTCYWCLGIWIAPLIYVSYLHFPWAIWILAIAELGCIVNALVEKIEYNE